MGFLGSDIVREEDRLTGSSKSLIAATEGSQPPRLQPQHRPQVNSKLCCRVKWKICHFGFLVSDRGSWEYEAV